MEARKVRPVAGLLLLLLPAPLAAQGVAKRYSVSVFAGAAFESPDGTPATEFLLESAASVWVTRGKEILIADQDNHCVRKVLANGTVTTVAGICGKSGYSGSGKPARESLLYGPSSAVQDSAGNIFIADQYNARIRKVDTRGVMTDYAGNDRTGLGGDEGPAAAATLARPTGMYMDASDNLYFSDPPAAVVRRISPVGRISRVAGTGRSGFFGQDFPAVSSLLNNPTQVTGDAAGNLYVADRGNNCIRRITPEGFITTVAGSDFAGYAGDGGAATNASLKSPAGVVVDSRGVMYIADTGNHVIRRVSESGIISTVAGVTPRRESNWGFSGDGGPARGALLNNPLTLALDAEANLLVADNSNRRVRSVSVKSATPVIRTVAGSARFRGDGDVARNAWLHHPRGMAVDAAGNLIVADTDNHRIRQIAPDGVISTIAGGGTALFAGDGGQASNSRLNAPWDVAIEPSGSLLLTDRDNFRVRRIAADGRITTVAGTGNANDTPGAGGIFMTDLYMPLWLTVGPKGTGYVTTNGRVRELDLAGGFLRDYAGRPFTYDRFEGDAGPALEAYITYATGLAADAKGGVWISDFFGQVVREVDANKIIASRLGFPLQAGFAGDGGHGGAARLNYPGELAFDKPGNLYVIDSANFRIRRMNTNNTVETIAGGGTGFTEGDIATNVELSDMSGLTVDSNGVIYVTEVGKNRILKLSPLFPGRLLIVAGDRQEGSAGARLPGHLAVKLTDEAGKLVIPGAAIKFAVVKGSASLSAAQAVTGPDGTAAITVSLGEATGEVQIRAESDGVPPVTFTLAAMAPVTPALPTVRDYLIATVAGKAAHLDGSAESALFQEPEGLAFDADGNLYVADTLNHRIRKIGVDGSVTTIAGNGSAGYSGDGGPALSASLFAPKSPAVDASGNVYFVDSLNHSVRKVSAGGVITTVFGNGRAGFAGEGRAGPDAQLNAPTALALHPSGIVVADAGNFRIRRLGTDGVVRTIAGTGTAGYSGDFATPTLARISHVPALAVDAEGNVYLSDTGNNRIRRIKTPGSIIDTVAGNGRTGFDVESGKPLDARLGAPRGLAADANGNLFVACEGRLVQLSRDGGVAVVAGTGEESADAHSGPAAETPIGTPAALAANANGNLYFSIRSRLLQLDQSERVISTVAGAGHWAGDGGPAAEALLESPSAALPSASGVFVSDAGNRIVRRIAADGTIATVAGNGVKASTGDGGEATAASLSYPLGLALDADGTLFIADRDAHVVRMVSPAGVISTVAGSGARGYSGDGGPASRAALSSPAGLALDAAGNLYVADSGNHAVRKVSRDGTITTVAGTGKSGYNGDGRPALSAQLDTPFGLALDAAGDLFITELGGHRVRRVAATDVIYTVAGTGKPGFQGDGGAASAAMFNTPSGIAVDPLGNLYVSDSGNYRIRKVSPTGGIVTVGGNGVSLFAGSDGGPAGVMPLSALGLIGVDASGKLYFADGNANRIRTLTPAATQ